MSDFPTDPSDVSGQMANLNLHPPEEVIHPTFIEKLNDARVYPRGMELYFIDGDEPVPGDILQHLGVVKLDPWKWTTGPTVAARDVDGKAAVWDTQKEQWFF